MKIEKLSDNQIRCTLTRADLAARQLQLSELAYGTEKAKSLFRDMMQQAAFEFGFEADDIPPVSYTHLDVYKRQIPLRSLPDRRPRSFQFVRRDPPPRVPLS